MIFGKTGKALPFFLIYNKGGERNEVKIEIKDLIYIGDEEKDFETARRAGCKFISLDRKKKNAAFKSMKEVLEYIYREEKSVV